jgi:plasmid stabilization system protein ParE
MVKKKIIWDDIAKKSLKQIIQYIREKSPQNAEVLKQKVLDIVGEIPKHPKRHNLDKYRIDNDGNFRAFEIYHIRISYYEDLDFVKILRVRSTYQEPLDY